MSIQQEISIKSQANHPVVLDTITTGGDSVIVGGTEKWELDLSVENKPFFGYGEGNIFGVGGLDYFDVLGIVGTNVGIGVSDGTQTSIGFSTSKPPNPSSYTSSQVIKVPLDYPTIQEAIDASSAGQNIVVSNGTYTESINFKNKDIVLTSEDPFNWSCVEKTIIQSPSPNSPVVTFSGDESNSCIIQGFTIRYGSPAIYGGTCMAIIRNNIIAYNQTPVSNDVVGVLDRCINIMNNKIFNNTSRAKNWYSKTIITGIPGLVMTNNLIYNNIGSALAGGAETWGGSVEGSLTLHGNVIYNNSIGGIVNYSGRSAEDVKNIVHSYILNNIIWGNKRYQFYECEPEFPYNCIQGYTGSDSSVIKEDPKFVDTQTGDFRLQGDSPCIGKGSPIMENYDINWRPRPLGVGTDIGAYEYYETSYGWGYEYSPSVIGNGDDKISVTATITKNDLPVKDVEVVFFGSPGAILSNNSVLTDINGCAKIDVSVNYLSLINMKTIGGNGVFVHMPESGFVTIKALVNKKPDENDGTIVFQSKCEHLFVTEMSLDINLTTFGHQYGYGY